ncbi:Pectinesterase [Ceratobasidium theobromae]|uniref:pectinesterase n=1 Tax=Ceratobasidium theobromae TaxID=1582974 RepID=A0A5N5QFJ4_9AGAM|nr:Pectinesterase [Ceratobasidium theobromae]
MKSDLGSLFRLGVGILGFITLANAAVPLVRIAKGNFKATLERRPAFPEPLVYTRMNMSAGELGSAPTTSTSSVPAAITTTTTSTSAAAVATGSIPVGAITIGSGGKYATIAAALVDTIYGQTTNKLDYNSNTVTITNNIPASQAGSNDASGTVRVSAAGVSLYNLNIANTYGKPVDQSQAIALSVQAGNFGAYACKITGYQDTLLANKLECKLQFGSPSRLSRLSPLDISLHRAGAQMIPTTMLLIIPRLQIKGTGSCYLGRPWREYARVIVQNSSIGSNIVAAGWKVWSTSDPRTGHVYYGEYANTGAGAWQSGRVSFATKMSSGVSISTVLGSTSWIDSAYM